MSSMTRNIVLNQKETELRSLLLEASSFIGSRYGKTPPQLRFTGGWVRDKLLGVDSHDIDIGIDNMKGFEFATLLREYLKSDHASEKYGKKVIGFVSKIEANPDKSKHLETATTKILGLEIDLVNLRKETYADDSRNPTIEDATPEEDAMRRDATVNALFYNLHSGEVEDFTKRGLDDMRQGIIKTPMSPYETFKDDPLRVLRSIRFASRLGYKIANEDQEAMQNEEIRFALMKKISRERVNTEITKMLQGPNPMTSLVLIDRLQLYNTIFGLPSNSKRLASTDSWSQAYRCVQEVSEPRSSEDPSQYDQSIATLREVLFRENTDDKFQAWTLACFTPWARKLPEKPLNKKGKPSDAVVLEVARDGLKFTKKLQTLVDDAVKYLPRIVQFRLRLQGVVEASDTRKAPTGTIGRDDYGLLIQDMGESWRGHIMFAVMVEYASKQYAQWALFKQYADWMRDLKRLDLLHVDKTKRLITGDEVVKALGKRKGPWVQHALAIAMAWQLRNPHETDTSKGITEVVSRSSEFLEAEGKSKNGRDDKRQDVKPSKKRAKSGDENVDSDDVGAVRGGSKPSRSCDVVGGSREKGAQRVDQEMSKSGEDLVDAQVQVENTGDDVEDDEKGVPIRRVLWRYQ